MRESWACEQAPADTAAARINADTNRHLDTPTNKAFLRALWICSKEECRSGVVPYPLFWKLCASDQLRPAARVYPLMRTAIFLAASLAATASYASWGECSNSAPRSAALPLAGATRIVVIGRAGSLKVAGRAGATEVRATGTACASSRGELADIQLRATRSGGEIRIEAEVPEVTMSMWGERRLDFEVSLPSNVPVKVVDGSGEMTIENTAALDVDDGSGGLT